MKGTEAVGSLKEGTGAPIEFEVTEAGEYYVRAHNRYSIDGGMDCNKGMTGVATLTVSPRPKFDFLPNNNFIICAGDPLDVQTNLTLNPSDLNNDNENDYTYSWSATGPNGYSYTGNVKNLSIAEDVLVDAGTYTFALTVINVNYSIGEGCPATKSVTVTVNENPEVTIDPVEPLCVDAALTITTNVDKGTGPYTYKWYKGNELLPSETSSSYSKANITIADAGTYKVIVTDVNGCGSAEATVTVTVNPLPVAQPTSNSPVCEGEDIHLEANSGNFDYAWRHQSNGFSTTEQNPVITDATLQDGDVYYLKITDKETGCTSIEASVTVVVNAKPVFDPQAEKNPVCEGEDVNLKGNITTPDSNIQSILWTGTNVADGTTENITVQGLTPGTHTFYLRVETTDGCEDIKEVDVVVHEHFEVEIQHLSPYCEEEAISLFASITGGAASGAVYHYQWQFAAGETPDEGDFSNIGGDSPTLEVTASAVVAHQGTYRVKVTTEGNTVCDATDNEYVVVNPTPTFDLNYVNKKNYCPGDVLTISVENLLPAGNYTYQWTLNGAAIGSNTATYSKTVVDSATDGGTYKVVVTNTDTGCPAEDEVEITVYEKPLVSFPANPIEICAGTPFTIEPTVTPGTADDYNFYWTLPDGTHPTTSTITVSAASALHDGTYEVKVTHKTQNCESEEESVLVKVFALPVANAGADFAVCEGSALTLRGLPNDMDVYTWSGPGGFTSNEQNPSVTANAENGVHNGTYTLTVQSGDGCVSTADEVVVTVNETPEATIDGDTELCLNPGGPWSLEATPKPAGGNYVNWEWRKDDPNSPTVIGNSARYEKATVEESDAGRYYVSFTDNTTNCSSYAFINVTVNSVDATLNLTTPPPYCEANEITFLAGDKNAGTGINYTYQFFINDISQGAPAAINIFKHTFTSADFGSNLSITVKISVEVTNNDTGCKGTKDTTITIYRTPNVNLTVIPGSSVCINEKITVTATTGYDTYTFYVNDEEVQTGAANVLEYTPTATGSYKFEVLTSATSKCTTFTGPETVTVHPLPEIKLVSENLNNTINPTNTVICLGDKVKFTASGGVAYRFFRGENEIAPLDFTSRSEITLDDITEDETITVIGKDVNGCENTSWLDIKVISETPLLVIEPAEPVCADQPVQLVASLGGTYYKFYKSAGDELLYEGTANSCTVTPPLTDGAMYYALVTYSSGCTFQTEDVTLSVKPLPVVTLVEKDGKTEVCAGESVTFVATGGVSYDFYLDGAMAQSNAGAEYSVSNLQNSITVYVVVTNSDGCSKRSNDLTITVHPLPTITLNEAITETVSVCPNTDFTFTAAGGDEYKFVSIATGGVETNLRGWGADNTYQQNITEDITIKVYGRNTTTDCENFATLTVDVMEESPVLEIIPATPVCADGMVQLRVTDNSGIGYQFFRKSTGGDILLSPIGTDELYECTITGTPELPLEDGAYYAKVTYGTEALQCTFSTNDVLLDVNELPEINLNAENSSGNPVAAVCSDDEVTFTATGGTAYEFHIEVDGVEQPVYSSTTGVYTTAFTAVEQPVTVTVYARGKGTNGCWANSDVLTITVNPLPKIELNGETNGTVSVCPNTNCRFTATGGNEYMFVSIANDGTGVETNLRGWGADNTYQRNNITEDITIKVYGRNTTGCVNFATLTVDVINQTPTLTFEPVATEGAICSNEQVKLVALPEGGSVYAFYDSNDVLLYQGANNYCIVNPPLVDGAEYRAVVTYSSGDITCNYETALTPLRINTAPVITLFEAQNGDGNQISSVCKNGQVIFVAEANASTDKNPDNTIIEYVFHKADGSVLPSVSNTCTVTLHEDIEVFVTVTDSEGCSTTSTGVAVTVNPLPTVTLKIQDKGDGVTTICSNETVTFEAAIEGEAGGIFTFQHKRGEDILETQNESVTNTFTPSNIIVDGDVILVNGESNATQCVGEASLTITIVTPEALITSSYPEYEICAGTEVILTASNIAEEQSITSAVFYLVGDTNPIESDASFSIKVTPNDGDKYTVVITNEFNCTATFETPAFTIFDLPAPTLTIDGGDDVICVNDPITFVVGDAADNDVKTYTVRFENAAGEVITGVNVIDNGDNTFTATFLEAGNVNVFVKVVNSHDCVSVTEASVPVTVNELPQFTLVSDPSPAIFVENGDPIIFTANPDNFADNIEDYQYQFRVNGNEYATDWYEENTWSYSSPNAGDIVTVWVRNNETGCINKDIPGIEVIVEKLPIEIPLAALDGKTQYCEGESGVILFLDGEPESGVTYYLVTTRPTDPDNIDGIVGSLNNNRIEWADVKGTFTYHVFAIRNKAYTDFSGEITVEEFKAPVMFNLNPDEVFDCSSNVNIPPLTLDGSEVGVTYYLVRNNDIEHPVDSQVGNGYANINFGVIQIGGSYTIYADNGACTIKMDGEFTLTTSFEHPEYNLIAEPHSDGRYCDDELGIKLKLEGTVNSIVYTYRLFKGTELVAEDDSDGWGSPLQFAHIETGSLYFRDEGVYTVVAVDQYGCTDLLNSSITIQKLVAPQQQVVRAENGGYFCGDSGVHIFMDAQEAGVVYELYYNNAPVGTVTGILNSDEDLYFEGTYSGTEHDYTVKATHPGLTCSTDMTTTIRLYKNELPLSYSVVGSDFCEDENTVITLMQSDAGVTYTLYIAVDDVFVEVADVAPQTSINGESITFTVDNAGTYTIKGKNPNCPDIIEMANTVTVDMTPMPDEDWDLNWMIVNQENANCETGIIVVIRNPEPSVVYELMKFDGANNISTGNTGELNSDGEWQFDEIWDSGAIYNINGKRGSCETLYEVNIEINISDADIVVPQIVVITNGGYFCENDFNTDFVKIGLLDSDPNVEYHLYRVGVEDAIAIKQNGADESGAFNFTLANEQLIAGTYYVEGSNMPPLEPCTKEMLNSVELKDPQLHPANVTIIFEDVKEQGYLCDGENFVLRANAEGAATYQFFVVRSELDVESLSERTSNNFYPVSWEQVMPDDQYYVVAYSEFGDCGTESDKIGFTVIDKPIVTLVGETEICPDATMISFEARVESGDTEVTYSYTFIIERFGSNQTDVFEQGANNVFIANNPANILTMLRDGDHLSVVVENQYGCTGADQKKITITKFPEIRLSIIDPPPFSTTIAEGTTVTFTVAPFDADNYDYYLVVNDVEVMQLEHSEWTYVPNNGDRVAVKVSDGNCATVSNMLTFTVEPMPDPFTLEPQKPIYCEGDDGAMLYITSFESNVIYTLINAADDTEAGIIGSSENNSYYVWYPVPEGTYYARAKRAIGAGAAFESNKVTVKQAVLNVFPITPGNGSTLTACGVDITMNGFDEGVTYYLEVNGTQIGTGVQGTSDTVLPLFLGTADWAGKYAVVGVMGNCEKIIGEFEITTDFNDMVTLLSDPEVTGPVCGDVPPTVELYFAETPNGIIYDYELYRDNEFLVVKQSDGWGSPLSFGDNFIGWGTYKVYTTYNGCKVQMNGEIVIERGDGPTFLNAFAENSGQFCESSTGVRIGIEGCEANVKYELWGIDEGFITEITPTTFTDTELIIWFSGIYNNATPDYYTVKAIKEGSNCGEMEMTVTLHPEVLPDVPVLPANPENVCQGTPVVITVTNVQHGVVYQLYFNGSEVPGAVQPEDETDTTVEFTVSQAGTYNVKARNAFGCESKLSKPFLLEYMPLPSTFTAVLSHGGTSCTDGAIITVLSSQSGVIYSLQKYVNGEWVEFTAVNTIVGTGSDLSFGPIFDNALFRVIAKNEFGCTQLMRNPDIQVNVPGVITKQQIEQIGEACLLGNGVTIALLDSEVDIEYTLYLKSITEASDLELGTIQGTGEYIAFGDGVVIYDGTYYVIGDNPADDGCEQLMNNEVTVKFEPIPELFVLQQKGIWCDGQQDGATLELAGSESDVTYYLMKVNGDYHDLVQTRTGDGSPITFDLITVEGEYQVYGRSAYGCTSGMSIIIDVHKVYPPNVESINAVYDENYCPGNEGVDITLAPLPEVGTTYTLYTFVDGAIDSVVDSKVGEDMETGVTFEKISEGQYRIVAHKDDVNCTANVNGIIEITAHSLPVTPVLEHFVPTCESTVIITTSTLREEDVTYNLINTLGEVVDIPYSGEVGEIMVWTLENLPTGEEFYYYIEAVGTNGCRVISNTITVVVYESINPFTAELPLGDTYCSNADDKGVTIGISELQSGVEYWLKDAAGKVRGRLDGDETETVFAGIFPEDTYTITGIGKASHCESAPVVVVITVIPASEAPELKEPEPSCEMPVIITTTTVGEAGVIYNLIRTITDEVVGTLEGNGTDSLKWEIWDEDFYHIQLVGECVDVSNVIEVVIHDAINQFSAEMPNLVYCPSDGGVTVSIPDLQKGILYTMKNADGNPLVFLDGNGTEKTFAGYYEEGTYTVTGRDSYCELLLATFTVTELDAPQQFTLSLTSGGEIILSGSELGVQYTLYRDDNTVVTTVEGTGSAISFGDTFAAGIYTTKALNTTTSCESDMLGDVNIIPGAEIIIPVEGFLFYCNENAYSGAEVTIVSTTERMEYQTIVEDTGDVFDFITGNGTSRTFNRRHTKGKYILRVRNFSTATYQDVQKFTVVEYAMPAQFSFARDNGIVFDTEIALNGAEPGVTYSLYRKDAVQYPPIVDELYEGVETNPMVCEDLLFCDALSFGSVPDAGYYYIQGVSAEGGCTSWMNGYLWIIENPLIAVNDTLYLGPDELNGTIDVAYNDILLRDVDERGVNLMFEALTDAGELFGKPWSTDFTLNASTGEFFYEKLPSFFGLDSVSYRITNTEVPGRSSIATIYIRVGNKQMPGNTGSFLLPNAFSPNGDGINDVFVISGLGETEESMLEVVNRWGTIVYRSTGVKYLNDWDGTANVSAMISIGKELPNGTYYYIFKVKKNVNGKIESRDYNGFVELRR
ncbi:MAG: gliding motility-associated C-terminal domain-containing protein [Cytophagaceae bacterium]|nr:gliding motility-associated C-terminal domain-containing protein [Cytophagaceae bacterium]